LVVFYEDRRFLPVIVKGETVDASNNKISYFTPENIQYLGFSIDSKRRISNYVTSRTIPFKETFEERFTGQTIFKVSSLRRLV